MDNDPEPAPVKENVKPKPAGDDGKDGDDRPPVSNFL
jgi:hypothetical protein